VTGALVFLTVLFLSVALRRSAAARQSRLQRMLARETVGGKARAREGNRPSRVPFVRRLQEEAWQAGLALRPQDVIGLMLGGCGGGFLLFLLLGQNLVFALGGAMVGLFAPRWWIRHQQSQRIERIGRQLPRALRMWASALRSGMSVQEALGLIVKEVPEPLHQELDRGYRAMVLGASQEEALGAIARRIGHDDFRLVVTAVEIHSELGGNLAERLDSVAETVESRIEARQTVGAKTA
jgi:tight adherence protein B